MQRPALRANVGGVDTDIPTATWVAGQFLRFNGTAIDTAAGGGGGITGPGSTTVGNVVSWNSTTGAVVADAGFLASDVVRQQNVSVTNGNLASYNGTTGRQIIDSLLPVSNMINFNGTANVGGVVLITSVGPPATAGSSSTLTNSTIAFSTIGSSGTGNVVSFLNAGGRQLADGGVLAANIVTATANAAGAGNIITSAGASKVVQDSGIAISGLKFSAGAEQTAATVALGTTLTAITGTSISLPAAGTYWLEALVITTNSASPRTIAYGISVSTGFTRCNLNWINYLSASTFAQAYQTVAAVAGGAVGATASGSKTGTSPSFPGTMQGVLVVSAACTIQILASGSSATVNSITGTALNATRMA